MIRRAALLVCFAASCVAPTTSPYKAAEPEQRDPSLASALSAEAAALIESEPEQAEAMLRDALEADIFCGAAHNNLGVLFLSQERFYDAASEFEWARKLMPGHPDPRVNLAITLDRAGMGGDAKDAYNAALEVEPGYMPAIQGLARLQLRRGELDAALPGWLQRIAFEGETEQWRDWARRELVLLDETP